MTTPLSKFTRREADVVYTYKHTHTHQILNTSGNQDKCYYNFKCANPLGIISSFNNVWSNIGYVLLGILFLFIVWFRYETQVVVWIQYESL